MTLLLTAAGIWNHGTDALHFQHGIDLGNFKNVTEGWEKKGFNLTKVFSCNGLWGGIWRQSAPGAWGWIGMDAGELGDRVNKWHKLNRRMVDLHYDPDAEVYGAVWVTGHDAAHVKLDMGSSEFEAFDKDQFKKGQRLLRVKRYRQSADLAGVWRSGDYGVRWGPVMGSDDFKAKIDERKATGWHLVDFDTWGGFLQADWIGLWHAGNIPHVVKLDQPIETFDSTTKDMHKKGWRLINMTLYNIATTDGLTP